MKVLCVYVHYCSACYSFHLDEWLARKEDKRQCVSGVGNGLV